MTEEQAMALKVGDIVETQINGHWRKVALTVDEPNITSVFGPAGVWVRRLGCKRNGARHDIKYRLFHEVRRPAALDGLQANIYADWLDDNDEPQAAAKLREAFPLIPRQEMP